MAQAIRNRAHQNLAGLFREADLRDYFAAKAMAAMVSRGEDNGQYAAESAYRFADEMLAARKK